MRKFMLCVCVLSLLAVQAYANDFAALERGLEAGRIINSVSDSAYLAGDKGAITESTIANLSSKDYGKMGLVADGNSRLILRYRSSTPGSVAFSVSPSIAGSKLESLTTRQTITGAVNAVETGSGYQASAVLVAPEAWPTNITYPSGNFTVTATFTPTSGSATTSSLTLTLMAPPVVLIHGVFGTNEKMFGHAKGSKTGVWHKLENAGLTVASWNYDSVKAPKSLIASNTNGLAQIITETLNKLNAKGYSATRVDLVTHSTGGLMARQYLRNDTDTGNKTANSYGLGTVRRVVTIASPNLGTPIASYIAGNFSTLPSSWQNWQGKTWWEGTGYTLIKGLALKQYDVEEAMQDFSLSSEYLAGLGYPGIPFHSIYGKIKSDESKISQLFDDVVTQNITNLSRINWLPEQLVDNLISGKLGIISGVLTAMSDDIRFKELLGALYGDDDYDLVVSETSAKDKFPANAVTSFTGIGTHNHVMIAQQDDVGDRVLALLKGSTDNFSINTASTAEYDAAFDKVAGSYAEYLRSSASDDLSEYLDPTMTLDTSTPQDEYLGADEDEPTIQSVKISGSSSSTFNDYIYVLLDDGHGATKFFRMNPSNKQSFDVTMWAAKEEKGLYQVYYFTAQNGKLKISSTQTVAYVPKFSSSTIPVISWSSAGDMYAHVGDKVSAGLIVEGDGYAYDISAPALGVASYSVSDSTIAQITTDGKIEALKEGTTKITATAYGHTASVNFVVKSATSEADTTKDISSSGSNNSWSPTGSSGGGCNAGISAMILALGLAMMKRH